MATVERPIDEVYRFLVSHSVVREDILACTRLTAGQWGDLMSTMRPAVEELLDRSIPFSQQNAANVALVVARATTQHTFLNGYRNAWPAELYIERNINNRLREIERRRTIGSDSDDGTAAYTTDDDSDDARSSPSTIRSPSVSSDVELLGIWDPADHPIDYGFWHFLEKDCYIKLTQFAAVFAELGVTTLQAFDDLIWDRGGAKFEEFMARDGGRFNFSAFEDFCFRLAVGDRNKDRVH
ncbi:hypothetical protein CONPUDRAFT_75415 [Coniophora puteana RWD-64-598 SS2]|uniref:Uncharacterized protein n=1 Tax=Coniophora puteana (strain RWD-64-598) TaxID=741705 RepID=A0A5M3MEA6_CONPW|nr:uncharacterized protein CONPUDRAFT_75415 [Coniophora puteana RWD-64-598 SS2]EIW77558.1 hypothetical protein CONPUDRAFT_75415 [Coniophora puteana RWD-64-598 SS2]